MRRVRLLVAAGLLAGTVSALPGHAATSPAMTLPCVDQVSAVNSRCELWSRTFNTPAHAPTVADAPAAAVLNRAGSRLYVATASTTTSGSGVTSRPVMSVAAIDTKTGRARWFPKPRTNLAMTPYVAILSPDQSTLVVAGTVTYLPSVSNPSPDYYWLIVAYGTGTGNQRWAVIDPLRGSTNVPVAAAVDRRGNRLFVTGRSDAGEDPWWETDAYSMRTGHRLWHATYIGEGGGSNWPVGLAVSPRGDRVYVAGDSEHPEHTGDRTWDNAVVAYNARTGHQLYRTVVHTPDSDATEAFVADPHGKRLFLAGTAIAADGSTRAVTVAFAARTGHVLWSRRHSGSGSSVARGLVVDPSGKHVVVAVGNTSTTAGAVGSTSIEVLGYTAGPGINTWTAAFVPTGGEDAAANRLTIDPATGRVFVAGVVGPPTLMASYPMVLALSPVGEQLWVARSDVRDPATAGAYPPVGGFYPNLSVAIAAAGGRVFDVVAYQPPAKVASATACRSAQAHGVPVSCSTNTGESVLVSAYAR